MRQYLTATIQAISKSELDGIVDPYFIKTIKDTDPNPEIRVYSIGHEGNANLHLPGIGTKTFTWIQAAVHWIADKLSLGTAVFDRHDPNTNSQIGRIKIGEVVGKAVRQIGDRLNTLAAIYIYPEYKSRPLDVASIEAEIEYGHDGFQAWPTAIKTVSGVALSNSGIDTPGFPGATLLGAVQAYVQAFGSEIKEKPMNLSDVQQAVRELRLKPSEVFDVEDIVSDKAVKANLQLAAKRVGEERDEARAQITKMENEKKALETQVQELQKSHRTSQSALLVDSIIADRKLDDKAKMFVKRNLKNFSPTATNEDGIKTELGKFVDDTHKEYQELVKDVFGTATNDSKLANPQAQFKIPPEFTVEGQKPTNSTETQHKTPLTRDEVLRAEMNPDVNPLIPGGKAALEAQKA